MIDVPKTHRHEPERDCPHATDRRTDDGSHRALLPIPDLDASGAQPAQAHTDALAESTLVCAR